MGADNQTRTRAMTNQPMTLFDSIVAPNSPVRHMAFGADDYGPLTPEERELFANHRRVWVDESLQDRIDFDAEVVDFRRDFGQLRLPFPHMWFEWTNVKREGHPIHAAAQCFEVPRQAPGEVSYLLVPWFKLDVPIEYDLAARVDLDARSGEPTGVSGYRRRGSALIPLAVNKSDCADSRTDPREGTLAHVVDMLWVAFVGVGFMNCRNVKTEHHHRPAKVTKKQRRPRAPKLDYHTIVLPGQKICPTSKVRSSDPAGLVPLHHVRGHFKTFTADAPLLGKHIGTYWWGWQMRGNAKNGIVVTDYKAAEELVP